MGNIGPLELILILVVALLVFGPKRLPEVGRSVGKGLREFRRASTELRDEFERAGSLEDAAPETPAASSAPTGPTPSAQSPSPDPHVSGNGERGRGDPKPE
jgi:sec-independent protein translocase protein TatA